MKKRTQMDMEELKKMVNGRVKKFVSLEEGAVIYSIGKNTFREMAKDARAIYRIKRRVLVNLELMDEYMECFQDEM